MSGPNFPMLSETDSGTRRLPRMRVNLNSIFFSHLSQCGSHQSNIRIYVRIRGEWRYLYRAIDKHGEAVDFLLMARRYLDAAKRFCRKMLKDGLMVSPDRIGTDGAGTYLGACCGCARASASPPRGPFSSKTGCSASASDFRRSTECKAGAIQDRFAGRLGARDKPSAN